MAAVSEQRVQPGTVLGGRYRVESLLGRGGMASVWSGVDQHMGRTIAIKVLHLDAAAGSTAWARFEREARSTAAVNDPHIVTVHDTGLDDGVAYLILERLPGPTLSQHLTQHGPMPVPMVLDITAQVCEALAAAHALGIVHRDIKPSNVMFADHRRVKVLDFGITQLIGDTTTDVTLTATGDALGTPAFMAPEQIAGQRVDARTDLYSLGCLITAMLAGKPPFSDASPWSVIASHAHHTPPDVRLSRPDTPPALAELVASLLAKDPEQRPATAGQVLALVRPLDLETSQTPDPAVLRSGRGSRRLAIAAAATAAVGSAIGIFLGISDVDMGDERRADSGSTPRSAVTSPKLGDSTAGNSTTSPTQSVSVIARVGGMTRACVSPGVFTIKYPETWHTNQETGELDTLPCTWFGSGPIDPEVEGWLGPIELSLHPDETFEEGTQPRENQLEQGNEESVVSRLSMVDGQRAMRVRTHFGSSWEVRWVVDLPKSSAVTGTLWARAVPYGWADGGVDESDPTPDGEETAAVLDAMIGSLRFRAPTPDLHYVEVTSDSCLSQREGPSIRASEITCVSAGTLIPVECTVVGDRVTGRDGDTAMWDRVTYNDKVGYVSDAWVSPSAAPLAPPC